MHRFRAEAQRAVAAMDPAWRAILDAYTSGVNSGLSRLRAAPFEYTGVGAGAAASGSSKTACSSCLSMFITLQDPDGSYEATLGTMHDVLPEAMADFLAPIGTEWDSPIVGQRARACRPFPGRMSTTCERDARESAARNASQLRTRCVPIEQESSNRGIGIGSWALGLDGRLGRWQLGVGS